MKRCEVCNLDLLDDTAFRGHLQGKRHQKNLQIKELRDDKVDRSIFVTGLHRLNADVQALKNYFSEFGEIKYFRHNERYLIVEYKESRPAKFLLSKPVYYNGRLIDIKKRIIMESKAPTNSKENNDKDQDSQTSIISYSKLKKRLEEKPTFEEQLEFLLSEINLTDQEIKNIYDHICSILMTEFRQIYPECVVYKFGSTVNGLGFKHCDLDIYIDIGMEAKQRETDPLVLQKKIFANAKKLMYRKSTFFGKIVPIPRAKIPIIKFTHLPSDISCDVNFTNDLGVHNSNLIKHCLSYDERLKPTMLVLKYWAKEFDVSGCGKITNYALVLMFIFYAQQPDVSLIPSIFELRQTCDSEIVNGWQVSFNKEILHENWDNKMSVAELVQGFLEFYAKFNFKEMVVCPLDGVARSKKMFSDIASLPACMDSYKVYASTDPPPQVLFKASERMCIQDPNELCRNVAANVSETTVERLVKQCKISSETCAKFVTTDTKDFLPHLFTATDPELNKKKRKLSCKVVLKPGGNVDPAAWYAKVVDCTRDVLENVYKLQVKCGPREPKQQKLEETSDVHSNDQDRDAFLCTGTYHTWFGRKNHKSAAALILMNYREKEIAISNAVAKAQDANPVKKGVLDFVCYLQMLADPVRITITFNDNNSCKQSFNEFSRYCSNKFGLQVQKFLEMMST